MLLESRGVYLLKRKIQALRHGTIILMSVTLVSSIVLLIYQIVASSTKVHFLENIILSFFLLFIYCCVIALALYFLDRKCERITIVVSILFLLFHGYSFLTTAGILELPTHVVMEDFQGKNITEVVAWAEKHEISVEQVYEHSDTVDKYLVIRQDVSSGTPLRDIKKFQVVVSDGPDEEIETEIPNMVGWMLDDVLDFVHKHFLTNYEVEFEYSEKKRGTVLKQDAENIEIKRNEVIHFVVSLGMESDIVETTMEDLVGFSLKDAEIFLKRNRLPYEIVYAYQEDVEKDKVLSQSVGKGFVVRSNDSEKIVITVSEKDKITVPDLEKMTATEITSWATKNQLKVYFEEEYDDTVIKGKILDMSVHKGEILKPGNSVHITLSKGKLVMIPFTTVDEFYVWARENEVVYNIDYQFSNSVARGKLISASHKSGQVIKNNEAVNLVVSEGGETSVPDFLGKSKTEAEKLCKSNFLVCEFVSVSSDKEKDTVLKQSMRSGSKVPTDTSITITISSGN